MNIVISFLFSILQGIFGLLPISSAGLTSFLAKLFSFEDPSAIEMSVMLHMGTALAILIVFRKTFLNMLIGIIRVAGCIFRNLWVYFKNNALSGSEEYSRVLGSKSKRMSAVCFVAMVPSFILGFVLKNAAAFFSTNILFSGMCFLITGVIFFVAAYLPKREEKKNISMLTALILGIIGGASVIPGISYIGLIFAVGMMTGLSKKMAHKTAILLYVPYSIGAFVYELVSKNLVISGSGFAILAICILITCLITIFLIKKMIRFVQGRDANFFALINCILGIIIIAFNFVLK